MSARDWHAHAVEEDAGHHPYGVWVARCGHQLHRADALHDEPPTRICPTCANPPLGDTP
ncbi:MAG: hypothetical protein ACRDR6_05070 [Pseudonocardiaceae bacterium]